MFKIEAVVAAMTAAFDQMAETLRTKTTPSSEQLGQAIADLHVAEEAAAVTINIHTWHQINPTTNRCNRCGRTLDDLHNLSDIRLHEANLNCFALSESESPSPSEEISESSSLTPSAPDLSYTWSESESMSPSPTVSTSYEIDEVWGEAGFDGGASQYNVTNGGDVALPHEWTATTPQHCHRCGIRWSQYKAWSPRLQYSSMRACGAISQINQEGRDEYSKTQPDPPDAAPPPGKTRRIILDDEPGE
jgi:hypothetical protein